MTPVDDLRRLAARILERQIIVRDSYGRPAECRACRVGIDTHHDHADGCDVPNIMALLGWPIPEPEPPSAAATARLPFDVDRLAAAESQREALRAALARLVAAVEADMEAGEMR